MEKEFIKTLKRGSDEYNRLLDQRIFVEKEIDIKSDSDITIALEIEFEEDMYDYGYDFID